ncbi:glycosyltransferase family 4 protein [Muriicola sp. Z0-33]|uniref:glycosyltransferase family 4 protein n=1 Tax=Muriicola sp. Z0-33 TaxID=2816957 RepID=UPI002237601D|nr:glycosyltransferase family 4 protein [Muriicola sp. Z0-33]MCW5514643.1 glycosyltransferase family 4 protein [Muriicola sp. Z0-33]
MNKTATNKVCHFTTVHPRYDTRVFVKECKSLARNGYDVTLIVADGQGDEIKDGVQILDIGSYSGRFQRVISFSKKIYQKAISLNADIYHFHDPELLYVGKKLAKKGKKVIYDAHEDVPRQLLTKAYIPSIFKSTLSRLFEKYEDNIASKLAGIATATPFIRDRFLSNNPMAVEIQNFPFIAEFTTAPEAGDKAKDNHICYVGAISKVRGFPTIVDALEYAGNVELLLGGKFESEELRSLTTQSKGWSKVSELGFLSRKDVSQTLMKSVAGLVVLEPTINYLDSIPVKMFEYMAAGIPVIASDFEYWRSLIQDLDCAIFVDPKDPASIGKAINELVSDKERAKAMGSRGKAAVLEKFNWANEERKLLDFYERVLLAND